MTLRKIYEDIKVNELKGRSNTMPTPIRAES